MKVHEKYLSSCKGKEYVKGKWKFIYTLSGFLETFHESGFKFLKFPAFVLLLGEKMLKEKCI